MTAPPELRRRLAALETIDRDFESRDAAKEWMIRHQLARRNITPEQRTYLIGKLYKEQKREVGRPGENGAKVAPLKTDEKIAEQFGVSPRTVHNAATFADAVDARSGSRPFAGARWRIYDQH
jgi:AraC-like DNA-binding protein